MFLTGFANFDEFDGHWTTSPPRHLSQRGWTTVTWYSLVHRGLSLTDCSGYLTPLHVSSVERASTTVDCCSCYIPTCTGSIDVADRVWFKVAITVHRCLHNTAPKYLTDCCVAGRQRLRSADRRQLDVPLYQRTTRAFSVAGSTVWNSLPDELRDESENTVRQSLKTLLFRHY